MENVPYKVYESEQALENARLLAAANSTYTERFYTLMKLIKISNTINNLKIISSPKMKEG
jgi:alpha-glucuronidase